MTTPPRLYRTYVDLPGGQIHCRIAQPAEARRPPLLCVHMSPKSGWVFEPLLERLGQDRLVVATDTPGFGMSSRPASPPRLEDYTDALAQVAALLAPGQAWNLLGYHTGSLISADMSLRYPELVSRIAMVSAPLLTAEEIAAFLKLGMGVPRAWDADGEQLLSLWRLVQRWQIAGAAPSYTVRSVAETVIAGDLGHWGHDAAFAFDFEAALRRVTHPLTILNLGDDLQAATNRTRDIRPDVPIVERPEWAHGFMHTWPDGAAETLAAMLD